MANDFSGDADCKALWRVENGALTTDSISTNTLTNSGVTADTTNYKEGSCSAKFDSTSAKNILSIASADQCAGFPLKSGDVSKIFSGCCWVKLNGDPVGYPMLFGNAEWNGVGTCLFLGFRAWSTTLGVAWGYSASLQNQDVWTPCSLDKNVWYHLGLVIDGINKTCFLRVYNATTEAVTTYTWEYPPNELAIRADNTFYIGCDPTDGWNAFPGICDEVVLFNDLLTADEIDEIRSGTYGAGTTVVPTTLQPTTLTPTTLAPTTVAPTTLQPTTEAPTTLAPTTVAPTTVSPTTEAPTTTAPTTIVPSTLAPTTLAPTSLAPTTLAPTTLAPTTVAPSTLVSTTISPTTVYPTTLAPTTEAPTTLIPTTLVVTTLAPTTSAPTTLGPTTVPPTTLVPTTTLPTICAKDLDSYISKEFLMKSYIASQMLLDSYITKEMRFHGNLCQ